MTICAEKVCQPRPMCKELPDLDLTELQWGKAEVSLLFTLLCIWFICYVALGNFVLPFLHFISHKRDFGQDKRDADVKTRLIPTTSIRNRL